jgi:hypothetical protein
LKVGEIGFAKVLAGSAVCAEFKPFSESLWTSRLSVEAGKNRKSSISNRDSAGNDIMQAACGMREGRTIARPLALRAANRAYG